MADKPDISFNWSSPEKIPESDPPIAQDDLTPTILEQARVSGWTADYYSFGKQDGQGTDFFNPGIVERPDGLWLLSRASGLHPKGFMYGQNAIVAFKLDDDGKQPHYGKVLKWPVDNPMQHFEDPRGFYHPGLNQTMIGCCTFLWNGPGDWTGPHQVFGAFDEEWNAKKMDYPKIGGNPGTMEKIHEHSKYEKNWVWWLHEGKLCLLYKANPWQVIQFGSRWSERTEFKGSPVSWPNGEIRGGTTPVMVGDYYWTFHHSSLPWKGRYRRYYAGAIAFEAKEPFTPRLITYEPLLQGSQNDPWAQHKPLVVFPCGAIHRNDTWLITCGVNDLRSAWIEIPHESLLKRMQPIGRDDSFIFHGTGVTKDEQRKQKLRENLAKARAARSARRNGGDALCPVTEESESQDVTTTGANQSSQSTNHQGSNAAATFKPKRRRMKRRKRRSREEMARVRLQALRKLQSEKTLETEEVKA